MCDLYSLKLNAMLITTTPNIEGHHISRYYGVVTGETIIDATLFNSYEEELREAKETALRKMEEQAVKLGANAVVGVELHYATVGINGTMLMVTANGTAVYYKIEVRIP